MAAPAAIAPLIADAAIAAAVPVELLTALIDQESAFDPFALGDAGEIGLGQLKPGTAADLGVNPWNPAENVRGAAMYLRQQFDARPSALGAEARWFDALRAYNAGPSAAAASPSEGAAYAQSVLAAAGMAGAPSAPGTASGGGGPLEWLRQQWDQVTDPVGRYINAPTIIAGALAGVLVLLGVYVLVVRGSQVARKAVA